MSVNEVVLSLDVASTTGWAVTQKSQNELSLLAMGLVSNKSSKTTLTERMTNLYDAVTSLIATYSPDVVILENTYFKSSVKVLKLLVSLAASCVMAAKNTAPSIRVVVYSSKSARKALGIRSALRNDIKPAVVEVVNKTFGTKLKPKKTDHHDMADACALGIAYFVDDSKCKEYGA